jgi:hypothetical protein
MRPTPLAVFLVGSGLLLALPPSLGFPHLAFLLAGFWAVFAPLLVLDALLAPKRGGLSWRLETPEVLHVGVPHQIALVARLPGADARGFEARLDTAGVLTPPPTRRGEPGPEGTRVTWELFARGAARFGSKRCGCGSRARWGCGSRGSPNRSVARPPCSRTCRA